MEAKTYDNTNSGVLFKNNRKEKDNHPDFTGNGNVDGKEVWINGWRKQSAKGEAFISISFREKLPKTEAASGGTATAQTKAAATLDDEIPF